MKTHYILAENWVSMRNAVKDTQEYLKVFNVQITSEQKAVDVANPAIYETKWSWSKLTQVLTKSMKPAYIYGLASPSYQSADAIGLLVDKNKAFEEERLRGQQSTFGGKQVMECYCLDNKETLYGFPRNSYVTIHETLHSLADHHKVDDTLHDYLDGKPKNLDAYRELLLTRILKNEHGLMPRVEQLAEKLVIWAAARGTPIRITEGYRSFERQNELYAQGRTKPGPKVTNAKGGQSMHQYRVAFDVVFRNEGYGASSVLWKSLGDYGESLGFEWGGRWPEIADKPHFQLVFGKPLKDFQNNNIVWAKYWVSPKIPYVFTRDLYHGLRGEDVRELQKYLNSKGFPVIIPATDYFGDKTKLAVTAFQKANKITPAAGYFGAKSRAFVSTHP